eukprot:9944818-Lingulodinium_polyedra.AAC.1
MGRRRVDIVATTWPKLRRTLRGLRRNGRGRGNKRGKRGDPPCRSGKARRSRTRPSIKRPLR